MLRRLFSSTVAWLVAAIFLLQLASVAAAMMLLHSQMLQVISADRTRQILDVRDDLVAAYYKGGHAGLASSMHDRRGSVADPLIFASVSSEDGTGPAPLLSHLAQVPIVSATGRPTPVQVIHVAGGEPAGGLAIRTELSDGSQLVVGALTAPDRRFDVAFAEAITLTAVLTMGFALLGALLIGVFISRRTHAIAATAEALGAGDFAARVGHADHGDGFDHLRRQMNFMAERIDRLVRELQAISGALAHDLRSPVARLKAAIETAQAAAPDGPAGEALLLARSDAEALETMLATALELARLESGTVKDHRLRLDLSEVAADLAELYEPLAEQSGVSLECTVQSVMVLVDRELISRALANLIDNALKYGGERIVISVRAAADQAVLEVADNGCGIAEADRQRVVGRFTRLEQARTRPGAGLGLAMVAAVAHLHGGTFELVPPAETGASGPDGSPGLIARIVLPQG